MGGKKVYLDNSAATRLDERVLEAMRPVYFENYAVATSEFAYTQGIEARETLDSARGVIGGYLGAAGDEIIFTSGSTESSNLALLGAVKASRKKSGHIIVSAIEDFPVLNSAKALEKQGYKVTYLPVDKEGFVGADDLKRAITDDTIIVSIQHANQEIGTIQEIKTLAEITKEKAALFHTDATHTFRRVRLDVSEVPADLITMSGHTIHGPRGAGALYVRKKTPLKKILHGGFQEFDLRPGVEDIASAVGFAAAASLVTDGETAGLASLRDALTEKVFREIPEVTLNGPKDRRLPQNANITFHYVEGEAVTLHLDMHGIAVSTGSACFSKSLEGSHVIMGIGGNHERAHGSIRFTFGRFNSADEIDYLVPVLKKIVEQLRKLSPIAADKFKGKG